MNIAKIMLKQIDIRKDKLLYVLAHEWTQEEYEAFVKFDPDLLKVSL